MVAKVSFVVRCITITMGDVEGEVDAEFIAPWAKTDGSPIRGPYGEESPLIYITLKGQSVERWTLGKTYAFDVSLVDEGDLDHATS